MDEITRESVEIILGSESDLKIANASGMFGVFNECGVGYELSIISAHRNREELAKRCKVILIEKNIKVVIAAASMAAVLPGDIAAEMKFALPVIGVPLPSKEFPDALDALLAMVRMPAGCPVIVAGIGKAGLKNAAITACQILGLDGDHWGVTTKKRLSVYLKQQSHSKPARLALKTNVREENSDTD